MKYHKTIYLLLITLIGSLGGKIRIENCKYFTKNCQDSTSCASASDTGNVMLSAIVDQHDVCINMGWIPFHFTTFKSCDEIHVMFGYVAGGAYYSIQPDGMHNYITFCLFQGSTAYTTFHRTWNYISANGRVQINNIGIYYTKIIFTYIYDGLTIKLRNDGGGNYDFYRGFANHIMAFKIGGKYWFSQNCPQGNRGEYPCAGSLPAADVELVASTIYLDPTMTNYCYDGYEQEFNLCYVKFKLNVNGPFITELIDIETLLNDPLITSNNQFTFNFELKGATDPPPDHKYCTSTSFTTTPSCVRIFNIYIYIIYR